MLFIEKATHGLPRTTAPYSTNKQYLAQVPAMLTSAPAALSLILALTAAAVPGGAAYGGYGYYGAGGHYGKSFLNRPQLILPPAPSAMPPSSSESPSESTTQPTTPAVPEAPACANFLACRVRTLLCCADRKFLGTQVIAELSIPP